METINITDIISYTFCPRKLYLKRIKGIKEPPNLKMIIGRLKHNVFDLFAKNEEALVSSINENLSEYQLLSIYQEALATATRQVISNNRQLMTTFAIPSDILTKDIQAFMKNEFDLKISSLKNSLAQGFREKQIWENLRPKYLTEFQIDSKELGLKGRIDRVELGENILPYELKTRANIYESDKLQLAAYALLLESHFNTKITKGIAESHEDRQEVELTQEMKAKVLDIADKIRNFDKNKAPPFLSNFMKCQSCILKKECFGE